MSFSRTLKTELCEIKSSECCRRAECYGFMLFGQSFTAQKISLLTDNEAIAKRYAYLIKHCFDVTVKIDVNTAKKTNYKVYVEREDERKRILHFLELSLATPNTYINSDIIKKDCCKNAFIRGMFMGCGQAADPEREYRIEFRIKNAELAYAAFNLLYKRDLEPRITLKKLTNFVYIKRSECVEDFLTLIGAAALSLQVMDARVVKDFRAGLNRKGNFEDANTSKIVNASLEQRSAIEYLIKYDKFSLLTEELQYAAQLRIDNPYAPLSELCKLSSVPITRSGLNHRLKKIMEIAAEHRRKE